MFCNASNNSALAAVPVIDTLTDSSVSAHVRWSNDVTGWGFNVSRFSLEMLQSSNHNHELIPDGQTHIHFDWASMGLGGYDSWSPNVERQYLIDSQTTRKSQLIRLVPLKMID